MCFRSNARTHWREAKIWVCRNPGFHPGAGHPGAGRPQPKPTRPTWTIRRPERKTACSERSDRRATAATCLVQLSHSHLHLCDVICDAMCVTSSVWRHLCDAICLTTCDDRRFKMSITVSCEFCCQSIYLSNLFDADFHWWPYLQCLVCEASSTQGVWTWTTFLEVLKYMMMKYS